MNGNKIINNKIKNQNQIVNKSNTADNSDIYNYKRSGIKNEGLTCYMNSIIQIMYNIPILVKYVMETNIDSNLDGDKSKNYEFVKSLKSIFLKLNEGYKTISIKELFSKLDFPDNNWNMSHDAHEYYIKIVEILISLNQQIKTLVYGVLTGKIVVKEKNYISEKDEEVLFFELEIEGHHNLTQCFKNYFKTEVLDGENKIEIIENNTKYYFKGTKRYKIKKIPDMIHIALKRFKFNNNLQSFVKLNNKIQFMENYDFSFLFDKDDENRNKNNNYILFSVLIHSGSYSAGHYYTIIKDFYSNTYMKLNDNDVTYISKNSVINDFCGGFYYVENYNVKYKYEKEENVYFLIYVNTSKVKLYFDYKNTNQILCLQRNNNKLNIELIIPVHTNNKKVSNDKVKDFLKKEVKENIKNIDNINNEVENHKTQNIKINDDLKKEVQNNLNQNIKLDDFEKNKIDNNLLIKLKVKII